MMDINDVDVNYIKMTEFKDRLLELSKDLFESYESISRSLTKLGVDWRDHKFDEFKEEFRPIMENILTISEQYEQWANGYLTEKIDNLVDLAIS